MADEDCGNKIQMNDGLDGASGEEPHKFTRSEFMKKYTEYHEEIKFKKKNTEGHEEIYKLVVNRVKFHKEVEDQKNEFHRISVGDRQNSKPSRSILLVGATGAGKSSLITSLVNRYFGIKFEDKFRIKIVDTECENKTQAKSQTQWITVYEFSHMSSTTFDYNLTIIDTPGLNDTRGLEYDQLFFKRLEKMLKDERFQVDEINCIGIVTPASANRLTGSQKYIYDGCMRLFGNDVGNIIHILATFSTSGGGIANIEDGLKEAGVKYVEFHDFNNSSIFLDNDPKDKRAKKFNEPNWDFMEESCGEFLNFLQTTVGQSLTKTRKTLEYRQDLYANLKRLDKKFLDNLNKSVAESENSKKIIETEQIEDGHSYFQKAFNCTKCHVTCHNPCYSSLMYKCKTCSEFSKEKKDCKICKCPIATHAREGFHYDYEYLSTQLDEICNTIHNLNEVALQPIPISYEAYIDELIQIDDNSKKKKRAVLDSLKKREQNMQILLQNPNEVKDIKHHVANLAESCKAETGKAERRCLIM